MCIFLINVSNIQQPPADKHQDGFMLQFSRVSAESKYRIIIVTTYYIYIDYCAPHEPFSHQSIIVTDLAGEVMVHGQAEGLFLQSNKAR